MGAQLPPVLLHEAWQAAGQSQSSQPAQQGNEYGWSAQIYALLQYGYRPTPVEADSLKAEREVYIRYDRGG